MPPGFLTRHSVPVCERNSVRPHGPLAGGCGAARGDPRSPALPGGAGRRSGKRDGASRARTGDLLSATQTLSQLSYGPVVPSKSSREVEIICPVDPALLTALLAAGSRVAAGTARLGGKSTDRGQRSTPQRHRSHRPYTTASAAPFGLVEMSRSGSRGCRRGGLPICTERVPTARRARRSCRTARPRRPACKPRCRA